MSKLEKRLKRISYRKVTKQKELERTYMAFMMCHFQFSQLLSDRPDKNGAKNGAKNNREHVSWEKVSTSTRRRTSCFLSLSPLQTTTAIYRSAYIGRQLCYGLCKECPYTAPDKGYFTNHMNKRNNNDTENCICEDCGYAAVDILSKSKLDGPHQWSP